MFHPRCQKAHDFNMTSVSGELRPRKFHHIRHPKEGSLISCLISSMRYVRVCVCLCGFRAAPAGGIQGHQSAGVAWAAALPCFAAFTQCGTVGDERES